MKRLAIIIMLILTVGCVSIFKEKSPYPNHLYLTAKEMPAGAGFLLYADVDKISANKAIIKQMGVPPELAALGMLVKSVRLGSTGEMQSGPDMIIVEGAINLDMILPMFEERLASVQTDVEITEEEYKGVKIHVTSGPAYFSEASKLYLGDGAAVKNLVDVKTGGQNATADYVEVLSRLPDGDILIAAKTTSGGDSDPSMMGASAVIKGSKAHATLIGVFDSAGKAQEGGKSITSSDSIVVESLKTEGNIVIAKLIIDLEKQGMFNIMGTTKNPEVEGRLIHDCAEKAKEACQHELNECYASAEQEYRGLESGYEDKAKFCEEQSQAYQNRIDKCWRENTDEYNKEISECWEDNYNKYLRECFSQADFDKMKKECESVCESVSCDDLYENANAEYDREHSILQADYAEKVNTECSDVKAAVVYPENSTSEEIASLDSEAEEKCTRIRAGYAASLEQEAKTLRERVDANAKIECENRRSTEAQSCESEKQDCLRRVDDKERQERSECEEQARRRQSENTEECQRRVEEEFSRQNEKCRLLEEERNRENQDCSDNINREWDEKIRTYSEERQRDCDREFKECYSQLERECAGRGGGISARPVDPRKEYDKLSPGEVKERGQLRTARPIRPESTELIIQPVTEDIITEPTPPELLNVECKTDADCSEGDICLDGKCV